MRKASVRKKATTKKNHLVKNNPRKHSGRGGKRKGAGRPKGSGKFGFPTKAVRIPTHMEKEVIAFVMKRLQENNCTK